MALNFFIEKDSIEALLQPMGS